MEDDGNCADRPPTGSVALVIVDGFARDPSGNIIAIVFQELAWKMVDAVKLSG